MCAVALTAGYFGYSSYQEANMTDAERMFQANLEALTIPEVVLPEVTITCSSGDCGDCFSVSHDNVIEFFLDPCEWEGQPIYYCPC